MSEPSQIWVPNAASRLAVLRAQLEQPGVNSVELPIQGAPVSCHLGTETGGSFWVRISCDPKSVSTDDKAAAVVFAVSAHGYKVTVSPEVSDVVTSHLFEEMIQLLMEGHPPGDVARTALQNWRDLLARPAGAVLNENSLVGLFGELEVLESIVRAGGELGHWTGWNKDHQDFRLPGLVIEVKSTTSANYRRVRIHGLRQLADPEDGSDLVMVLKRLETSPTGRSVPEIVESLVRMGVSRSALLDRLSNTGYFDQHRSHYVNVRFVSAEAALRKIDEFHPRLVPDMLSAVDLSCIDKIDYELNLNGVADADLDLTLDELLNQSSSKS